MIVPEISSALNREAAGCWTRDGFSFYYYEAGTYADIFRADRILPICIPAGQPARGKTFSVACRRDPGDVGVVVCSLLPHPPLRIPGAQGFLAVHPSSIVWNAVGAVGNMGRFTTRVPIPDESILEGVALHWQAAAQDRASRIFISPAVATKIQ